MTRSKPERKMGHPDHWVSGSKPGDSLSLQCAGQRARRTIETDATFGMEASARQGRIGRLLRLGVSGSSRSSADDSTAVGELETELALLREENAWLKVERHRPPDAGRIVERMRELSQAPSGPATETEGLPTSEAAQAMLDCLAIRNGLLEACKEIQEAMQGLRARLSGLSVDVQGRGGDRAAHGPISTSSNGKVERDLAVEARHTTDLSKNAV